MKPLINTFNRVLLILVFLGLTACNLFDNKMQGYVGEDSRNPGWGSTVKSSLVVMTSFVAKVNLVEGGVTQVNLQLSQALPADTDLQWSIDGGLIDFDSASGTIPLLKGATTAQFTLSAKVDGIYEGIENYDLVIQGPTEIFLAAMNLPLSIQELGTQPVVSFSQFGGSVNENTPTMTVTLGLSQPAAFPVQVSLQQSGSATSNVDYTASVLTSVVFEPGEIQKTIQITFIDDAVSEVVEDIILRLKSISQGNASIDGANNTFTVLIQDNDATSLFSINGVRGGADVVANSFLTAGNIATITWTRPTASANLGYEATVFEEDGTTVKCQKVNTPIDTEIVTFGSCALTEGGRYRISVVALVDTGPVAANNNMTLFTVDTLVPTDFGIIGVMGGYDVSPDGFLSGSTRPTLVWEDSVGESGYNIFVYQNDGVTLACQQLDLPPNVSSYYLESCNLLAGGNYKLSVVALDVTGVTKVANNDKMAFKVTSVASGFLIAGVTGGISDTTLDAFMDDGDVPVAHWQSVSYAVRFDAVVKTLGGVTLCTKAGLPASVKEVIFDASCFLRLNDSYNLEVTAYDSSNVPHLAANGPYVFTHRVGLYINGSAASKSYYKGVAITSCGGVGGSLCNATTPYVVSSKLDEVQIRLDSGGVITAPAWSAGLPTVGNGVLDIRVKYLRVEGGSRISMDGKGYPAAQGPGAGTTAVGGGGGAHGGYAGGLDANPSGVVYGTVDYPESMGSGGGNAGVARAGGRGGGVVVLEVLEELRSATGYISSNGINGLVNPLNPYALDSSGGGAGGSVLVKNVKFIVGSSLYFEAKGGDGGSGDGNGGGGPAGAGSGGRIALYYDDVSGYAGGFNGLLFRVHGGVVGYSGAAGTVFRKQTNDIFGSVFTDNNSIAYRFGIETPLPIRLYDSVTTKTTGTFILPSTDIYTLVTNVLDFRLVVAGTLKLPGDPPAGSRSMVIGANGLLDWRKVIDFDLCDDLTINQGGTLTHSENNDYRTYSLVMNLTTLVVNGSINLNGKGYAKAKGPGAADGVNGASHGGQAALLGAGLYGSVYGNILNPTDLGSGGGGASGGGRLDLTVSGNFTMGPSGSISANGGNGWGLGLGTSAGSGGSILIQANNIYWQENVVSTNAYISALGGDGVGGSGSGAGGRVAIYYNSFFPTNTSQMDLRAYGGSGGGGAAAAGTIFTKQNLIDINGHLIVTNSTRTYNEKIVTPLTDSLIHFDTITTDSTGTLYIPQGMNYEFPTSLINFRFVVAGSFSLPGGGKDLTLSTGAYLEWRKSTRLVLDNLTVSNGAVIAHTSNFDSPQYSLWLDVTGDLVLDGGVLNADSRGYARNKGPGLPVDPAGGAAHAGYGGLPRRSLIARSSSTPYGMNELRTPVTPGSGSRDNMGYPGASGGGVIHLTVGGTLTINNSTIAARGNGMVGDSTWWATGGGAGGSIWIEADDLQISGSTVISASGGRGSDGKVGVFAGLAGSGGCGSGGRIALHYANSNILNWQQAISDGLIDNKGGLGATCNSSLNAGSPGTVFIRDIDDVGVPVGDLYIYNKDIVYVPYIETPVPEGFVLDHYYALTYSGQSNARYVILTSQNLNLPTSQLNFPLAVEGLIQIPLSELEVLSGGIFEWRRSTALTLNQLTVRSGGIVTHQLNATDHLVHLKLELGDLTLDSGAVLESTGRGFARGQGPGYSAAGAGAYGGNTKTNRAYGSAVDPINIGSGSDSVAGGGMVSVVVTGTATINGIIRSNGENATGTTLPANGGSGGTISIDTQFLAGSTGWLEANGGDAFLGGEGGSGGRIALRYDDDSGYTPSGIDSLVMRAYGGLSTVDTLKGSAGTVYYKNKSIPLANGILVIKNRTSTYQPQIVTPIGDADEFDQLLVDGTSRLLVPQGSTFNLPSGNLNYHLIQEGDLVVPSNQLTIQNGGIWELRTSQQQILNDITMESGSKLSHSPNVDVKKYWLNLKVLNNFNLESGAEILADEAGHTSGYGAGSVNSVAASNLIAAAGSFAGRGYFLGTTGGNPYGSATFITELGSGGGTLSNVPTVPVSTLSGGAGGGLIDIDVGNDFKIDGRILSRGGSGLSNTVGATTYRSGAGSGGSIKIKAYSLSGSGYAVTNTVSEINASGGGGSGAQGGGGRIIINYTVDNFPGGFDPSNATNLLISNRGGTSLGAYNGAAGTTLLKQQGVSVQSGKLFVNNTDFPFTAGIDTLISGKDIFDGVQIGGGPGLPQTTSLYIAPAAEIDLLTSNLNFPLRLGGLVNWPASSLTVKEGGRLIFDHSQKVTFAAVTVESGGVITHSNNKDYQSKIVNMEVTGDLDIQAGGAIDVSGMGYSSGNGQGQGSGNGVSAGSGAGHGGLGGGSVSGVSAAGMVYDTVANPLYIGSGGGLGKSLCVDRTGGSGGGALRLLVAGQLTLAGALRADGLSPVCASAGGGSGGYIWLKVGTLADGLGAGVISANGGSVVVGSGNGGGGGGGLLSVEITALNSFTGTSEVTGGAAWADRVGQAGLIQWTGP